MKTFLKFLDTHLPLVSWDYLEYTKYDPDLMDVNDWKRTLVTKINLTSATIFKDSERSGANYILIHPHLRPLIESHEFFKNDKYQEFDYYTVLGTLAGRYTIILLPEIINKNKIYVCSVKGEALFNWKKYKKVGIIDILNYTNETDTN